LPNRKRSKTREISDWDSYDLFKIEGNDNGVKAKIEKAKEKVAELEKRIQIEDDERVQIKIGFCKRKAC